jgi:hypothetical protein
MAGVSGLIVWSTSGGISVCLIVTDGVITDVPPYARRWALGQPASEIWRQGRDRGVHLTWIPRGQP